MKRGLLLFTCCVLAAFGCGLNGPPAARTEETAPAEPPVSSSCPEIEGAQAYDVIIFGDEVPGVMTALKVQRELRKRRQGNRVAIVTEGDISQGIGGHLVRGGLAYLDRNQVPPQLRSQYGIFGRPSRLYTEFLALGKVDVIALDRYTIAAGFERALRSAGIDVIGNSELESVQTTETLVCAFVAGDTTYTAKQFIDASQSGELADASGVAMMDGLEALGLPDSTLSIGLVFELSGITPAELKKREAALIQRFFDPNDREAQTWLAVASGGNPAKRQDLLQSLYDDRGNPKLFYQGTPDSLDVRSLAFSIAVHGQLGREYDLKASGFLFDRANVAVFDDRLSFNALLFHADAHTAQALSRAGGKPNAEMQAVADEIEALFSSLNFTQIEFMDELYIRNAGQIANPLDELSATLMTAGGIPAPTALGTFSYHLDDRGGIEGLDDRLQQSSLQYLNFRKMPTFNYGFRHTLPTERENLAVLGPASGFGGLGTTAGRIVEFNVGVGEGLAIAIAKAIAEERSLHTINNFEVRQALGYDPATYGRPTESFQAVYQIETNLRGIDYEANYAAQAQTFFEQRNYAEAVRVLSREIALNPGNAEAHYLRGNALLNLQRFDFAVADYTEAIRINPKLTAAYLARGMLHALGGEHNQGIADFDRILAIDPGVEAARFGRDFIRSLQRSGRSGNPWYADALPLLDATIERQPELAMPHILRGLARAEVGDRDNARADLEQAEALLQAHGSPFDAQNIRNALESLLN